MWRAHGFAEQQLKGHQAREESQLQLRLDVEMFRHSGRSVLDLFKLDM